MKGMIITDHDKKYYIDNVLTPLKDCRNEFTNRVETEYANRNIDSFLKELCQTHGYDVVATLVSKRIQDSVFDGRYSNSVKEWAVNYQTSLPIDGVPEEVLQRITAFNTHPVIVNSCAVTLDQNKKELQSNKKESSDTSTIKEEKISYVDQLYEKMSAQQDTYREWLLTQPPSEILNHTYEYTVREDILLVVETKDITEDEAKELLKSDTPLDDVYDRFDKKDISYMQDIKETFSEIASHIKEYDEQKGMD